MHLLVTRPEPDASALAKRLRELGHSVTLEPLLSVVPATSEGIALDGVQALIVTSRNALRALADRPELAAARRLLLVVVGPSSAAQARHLGFTQILEGPAAARDLLPVVLAHIDPQDGTLLHLAGEDLAFDVTGALATAGYATRLVRLYRTVPRDALGVETARLLGDGALDGVLLMSPRTAATWGRLVAAAGLASAASNVVHICLSTSVASALGTPRPGRIEVSVQPNLEEMLALVGRVAAQSSARA